MSEIISEEEAREKLWSIQEQSDYSPSGAEKFSLGQLISMAVHAVSPEAMVPWCPTCDRKQSACICDDEEAKKDERDRQMKSKAEKEKEVQAVMRALRDRLSEEEIQEIKEKREAQKDMEFCPVCDTKRVEDLIYETKEGTVVGCQLCLDRPEEVVVN